MENLESLIRDGETATLEFKVAAPRAVELAERICGFANSKLGGTIIIGVQDKTWDIVGIKNVPETIDIVLQASRMCKPPVSLNPPQPQVTQIDGKTLVIARIPPNPGILYQSGGVFWVRRGTHTTALDVSEVERYLYNVGILNWETQPLPTATLEDLDLRQVEAFLEQRSSRSRGANRLANVERILLNIGCATNIATQGEQVDSSSIHPTNAGMLLFGYRPQDFLLQSEIICALYQDDLGMRRFADRRIFHGTLAEQIDQAEAWLRQYISVPSRIEGFHRIDEPQYPLEALREAVVNAVVHRDYSLKGAGVRILFYPNRIEIRNPGLLMPGIDLENLRQGKALSNPRNPLLANVLRDLPGGYMERMGSGISFMINQMRLLERPDPDFREQGEFIVTFYLSAEAATAPSHLITSAQSTSTTTSSAKPEPVNISTAINPMTISNIEKPSETQVASASVNPIVSQLERQQLAVQYIQQNGLITNKQYRELTRVSERTAFRDLEVLVEQGTLRAVGEKRARYYVI